MEKGEYIFPGRKKFIAAILKNNEFSGAREKLSDKTGKVLYEGKWKKQRA
jgi:hypothetical protein